MLQQAPSPSQHENPLKKYGFHTHRSSTRSGSERPVHLWYHAGRPASRWFGRPRMTEHEFHADRQNAVKGTKRLVTHSRCAEGLGGGQSAPACHEHTRSPASAQNSAQPPEIRGLKSNPLYIHHHVGKTGVYQSVSEYVHLEERMHAMRFAVMRPCKGEFFQCAGSEGAQQHQPTRTQRTQTLRQCMVDRVDPWQRHTRQNKVHGV